MSINEFAKENRQRWLDMDTMMSVILELDEKLQHTLEMAMRYAEKEGAHMTRQALRSDVDRAFRAIRDMHYLSERLLEVADREADRFDLQCGKLREAS